MTAHHARPGQALDEVIAALPDGAVLEVEAGTYPANVILDRSITVRGLGEVVLDGQRRGPVVRVNPGRHKVRLEHLTIRHGSGPGAALGSGGEAHIELVDVVVRDNDAGRDATIHVPAGTLLLERCRVVGNDGGFGAALLVDAVAHATLRGSLVVENRADESILAVRELGQLSIEHSTLAGNEGPIAIEVRATSDRQPTLRVRSSVVSHPKTAIHNGPRLPGHASVERSVVDGGTSGVLTLDRAVKGASFAGHGPEPFRPTASSAAASLAQATDAKDLTGASLGTTAGALAALR